MTVGLLGVAAAAVLISWMPVIEDARSSAIIAIEETEVVLLIFELMLYAKAKDFRI